MNILESLSGKIQEVHHRRSLHQHPFDFWHLMKEYWPVGQYMLKKFGWKSWYTFWFTRLFVVDEGGEYDFSAHLLTRFPGLLKKPWKIEVEHTTMCNKQCTFCSHTHFGEKQEQMSFEHFTYLIDSIPSLKWLNLAGIGSFFLHKDALKMVAYARKKQINVNFVDEFDFFDEDHARKIVELGVHSIYVSFDAATKATYEMMKKRCDFDKALHNIRTLLKVKEELGSPFPILHFRFLVTTLNYHEMPDYITLIASLPNRGVRARVEFIGLITFPGIEEYYIPMEQVPEAIKRQVYQNALAHHINLYFSHSEACLPSMNRCVRWGEPFVLVNGNVISDCAILMQHPKTVLNTYSFGNAFERPFMEIWNSPQYREFRKLVVTPNSKVPKSCAQCCAFQTQERVNQYGIWDRTT
jgi:MoaA/NifB/PqqE/SkfB family radical SAM enzyme